MTVRRRVSFGFSMILLFVLAATAVSVLGSRASEQRVAELRERQTRSAIEILRLQQDILRIQSDLTSAASVRSGEASSRYFSTAQESYESAQARLVELTGALRAAGATEALSRVTRIQREIAEFYAIGTSMAQTYIVGGTEAGNEAKERFDPYVARMEENLNALVELRLSQMDRSFDEILAAGRLGLLTSLVSGGVALVTVLLVLIGVHRSLARPLTRLLTDTSQIAEGDLTVSVENERNDEIGVISRQVDRIASKLDGLVCAVRGKLDLLLENTETLAAQLGRSSEEVSLIRDAVEEVAARGEEEQSHVGETSSAVEQIARSIESLDHSIQQQNSQVAAAASAVEESLRNVESIGATIDRAKKTVSALAARSEEGLEQVNEVSRRVEEMVQKSGDLENANEIINGVAAKTNLLAMNAAIEAAHAGEAGRGFAVVAAEIRSLAEQTAGQSASVAENLRAMSDAISHASTGATKNREIFGSIQERVTEATQIMDELAGAIEEQRSGNDQVRSALNSMRSEADQVASGSREMASGNQRILSSANALQEISSEVSERIRGIRDSARSINSRVAELSGIADDNVAHISEVIREAQRFHLSIDANGCPDPDLEEAT
jgi:methyl-accepting chemotaxis protein